LRHKAKKNLFGFSVIAIILFFSITNINAVTNSRFYANGSGTEVKLSAVIPDFELETGTYEMNLTLELLTLNPEAFNIIEIELDYRIKTDYYTGYLELDETLDEVGSILDDNTTFYYNTEWGTSIMEITITLTENISESIKNSYSSLWFNFFSLKPKIVETNLPFGASMLVLLIFGLTYRKKRVLCKKIV
jgi:hypothetical protein